MNKKIFWVLSLMTFAASALDMVGTVLGRTFMAEHNLGILLRNRQSDGEIPITASQAKTLVSQRQLQDFIDNSHGKMSDINVIHDDTKNIKKIFDPLVS